MNIRTKAYPWGNGDEVNLFEPVGLFCSLLTTFSTDAFVSHVLFPSEDEWEFSKYGCNKRAREESRGGFECWWMFKFTNSVVLAGTRRLIIIIRMSRTSRVEKVGGLGGIRGQLGRRCEGERQAFGNARFKPSVTLRYMLYLVLCRSASMDYERMV